MIIIVSGSIGRLPVGGHAWIDVQYLLGLQALGHEVYYVEDCGPESWVYDWGAEQLTTSLDYPAGYVRDCLGPVGLGDRWIYRTDTESAGMPLDDFLDVCSSAHVLLIRAVPVVTWRPEYLRPKSRVFVDSDPGFTQISWLQGRRDLTETIDRCEALFTFGQRIGAADCPIPSGGRAWHPTVAPVALDCWPDVAPQPEGRFTCVMQWRGFREVTHNGVRYGQKDLEFPRFLHLPQHISRPFLLALTGESPEQLTESGWHVEPGWEVSRTMESYQQFIQGSFAEFSVAKHGYVKMRGGWFSDRSVCYLASGRPALVQDTGLADWLPVGQGVVTFSDPDGAVSGAEAIEADYDKHCKAARQLAEDVFDARTVLAQLLERVV